MKTLSSNEFTAERLEVELQSHGLRLQRQSGADGRQGGAGPSDHKAINIEGSTIMVPVYNDASQKSPFWASEPNMLGVSQLYKDGEKVASVTFPKQPNFYSYNTSDDIPMWKIAKLHSHNVLATTVLQRCIRYDERETSCQFCAIGQSLESEETIAYKRPYHLAEVAEIAVREDDVEQFVMTTGTPNSADRGAKILFDSVIAVKEVVDIDIQVQCEPPNQFIWFELLNDAGADSIGMHLEAVTPAVRQKIMPGKAQVSVDYYMEAFEAAVKIFGRGDVSTYLLAGLGDTPKALIDTSRQLIDIGIYPFVVPFVPIKGTPLEDATPPSDEFMESVLEPIGAMLVEAGMTSDTLKAGCGKCGACSALKSFEKKAKEKEGAYAV